jgi:hypothetical protein
MEIKNKQVITVSQINETLYNLAGKAIFALFPIFIYGIIQLFRVGILIDYLILLIGCILSVAAIMGYIINELVNGIRKRKSHLAMILAFGGFIPWLFGSYLFLIKGFWPLRFLLKGFSITLILKSLAFIVLGFIIVSNFHKITKVGENIRNGNFIINDE